jgi:hypothetical protein
VCFVLAVIYMFLLFFFNYLWGRTKSLDTAATSGLLYKPQMIDEDDCGAIGVNDLCLCL